MNELFDEKLTSDFYAYAEDELNMDLIGVASPALFNELSKPGRRPDDISRDVKGIVVFAAGFMDPLYRSWAQSQGELLSISAVSMNVLMVQGFRLKSFLKKRGYRCWDDRTPGPSSIGLGVHQRHAFQEAGVGYIGKNQMAVSEKYGPRMNLWTFLTDAPLTHSEPYTKNLCGNCKVCQTFCPSGAIMGDGYYNPRQCESVVNCLPSKCYYSKYGWDDCDMCMRMCPQGEYKYEKDERKIKSWWEYVEKNHDSPISQNSIYSDYLKKGKE